jgi:hypothetical protein
VWLILKNGWWKKVDRSNKLLKVFVLSVAVVLLAIWVISDRRVKASSFGPPPGHTDAPGESNCTACHTSFELNSGPGNVMIAGLPANYSPNQEVMLSVTTFHPDGFLYGFQLTAIDPTGAGAGTLVATDTVNTQLSSLFVGDNFRQYIEHTFAGAFPVVFDQRTWTFKWIAPSTNVGPVTFYAAGNGANGDGESTGDYIYTASATTSFRVFDACIKDESNGNSLQVNFTTGEYQFSDCQGVTVGGTGTLVTRGCTVTLQHTASDRRLLARIDTCSHIATASLQTFSPARTLTIGDRNTVGSDCVCQ